jgi:Response regulator containing CheY-like receiver domain and AraC-type DNA-binding domain
MLKVVVIEDEIMLRNGLLYTMPWEEWGCEVIGHADNGLSGLELIRRVRPDIAITDIKMPGLDGIEMIRRLGGEADCEFILITGHSEFEYAKSAVDLGVQGYILKPIDDEEFRRTVRKAAGKIMEKRQIGRVLTEKPEAVVGQVEKYLQPDAAAHNRFLDLAIQYIHDHFRENITLKDIADHLQISESYLTKIFRAKTSYSVVEYITQYRLKQAIELLMDAGVKIYEIAGNVGYQDSRYFSTLFKKEMGLTPSEFRNYYLHRGMPQAE